MTKQKNQERELNILSEDAVKGINLYLDQEYKKGRIRKELYNDAKKKVIPNITKWLKDKDIQKFSPNLKQGIRYAINNKRWEDIIYAFIDDIAFGTAGIRGIAAFNQEEVEKLAKQGIDASILKGPNTINNIVYLLKSIGVAEYAREKKFKSIVIGYDSRIHGQDFAHLITKLFLASGLTVYLFDEASPYPELLFATPLLNADLGILISASHNDKRYNGYKLNSDLGMQFDPKERNYIYNKFIKNASLDKIQLKEFTEVEKNKLIFLGGDKPLENVNYYGRELIDIHQKYIEHVKKFILDKDMLRKWAPKFKIGYAAYYGAGRKAVPRLLKDFGFTDLKIIHSLNELNGLFPCFSLYQQPDPGDIIAAEIAVEEFKKEYGKKAFQDLDFLIGTDPDADRASIIIKIPKEQQDAYREILKRPKHLKVPGAKERSDHTWLLLDADIAWTILLWYRLEKEKMLNNGILPNAHKRFIVLPHTTSELSPSLVKKYGLGSVRSWVGFAIMSNIIDKIWDGEDPIKFSDLVYKTVDMGKQRTINDAAVESSSGFSIYGGKPLPGEKIGENGHIRDKDGPFAVILLTELLAYAKSQNKNILELIDEKIYLDPEIGLIVTYYEPIPYWGQFEGPTGLSKKIDILKLADKLQKKAKKGEQILIGGKKVLSTERYYTGKYEELHRWPGYPDEGMRFYFDKEGINHLTIRPSGTSHCIRFHVQLKAENVTKENLIKKKVETYKVAKKIVADIRKKIVL